jgi:tyrosine-protein kinase Etk/Wzc
MSMSNLDNKQAAQTDAAHVDQAGMIDILIVVAKYKKVICLFPLAMMILALVASFLISNVYRADTKLLPPQQAQSTAAALLSQLGGVAGMAAGAAGMRTPNDVYIGMLKSRAVMDRLIASFDLKKVYGTDSVEMARRTLENNTFIETSKDGLITVAVEDEDRELVAKLANAYVSELIRMTSVLAVTEAGQRRMFFESQLEQSKNNLAKAETKLKGSLTTSGVVSVDSDSQSIIANVSRLRAQISSKEIQIDSMSAFVTPSNQDYRQAQQELSSLRAQLNKLENGTPDSAGVSPAGVNEKGALGNIQLLRDVKYYQMLYELLAKQYEAARLEEARQPSLIQVLDPAIAPERKIKPKRLVILIVALVLGVLLALFWAFVKEALSRASAVPTTAMKLKMLSSLLRGKKAGA